MGRARGPCCCAVAQASRQSRYDRAGHAVNTCRGDGALGHCSPSRRQLSVAAPAGQRWDGALCHVQSRAGDGRAGLVLGVCTSRSGRAPMCPAGCDGVLYGTAPQRALMVATNCPPQPCQQEDCRTPVPLTEGSKDVRRRRLCPKDFISR